VTLLFQIGTILTGRRSHPRPCSYDALRHGGGPIHPCGARQTSGSEGTNLAVGAANRLEGTSPTSARVASGGNDERVAGRTATSVSAADPAQMEGSGVPLGWPGPAAGQHPAAISQVPLYGTAQSDLDGRALQIICIPPSSKP
jgi:hypothetical protein